MAFRETTVEEIEFLANSFKEISDKLFSVAEKMKKEKLLKLVTDRRQGGFSTPRRVTSYSLHPERKRKLPADYRVCSWVALDHSNE